MVDVEGNQPQAQVFPYQSAHAVELYAILQLFQEVEEAFNLVSGSQYVVQAVQQLETVGVIKAAFTICTLLSSSQIMIWERKHSMWMPSYVMRAITESLRWKKNILLK